MWETSLWHEYYWIGKHYGHENVNDHENTREKKTKQTNTPFRLSIDFFCFVFLLLFQMFLTLSLAILNWLILLPLQFTEEVFVFLFAFMEICSDLLLLVMLFILLLVLLIMLVRKALLNWWWFWSCHRRQRCVRYFLIINMFLDFLEEKKNMDMNKVSVCRLNSSCRELNLDQSSKVPYELKRSFTSTTSIPRCVLYYKMYFLRNL